MRERKYVKVRVDMYDDTKSKIIDRRPERDLIHYIWNRVMLLAGKSNEAGELYMSRTIPYTVETLAIEFNREPKEVTLALKVLIELVMVEVTEEGIYKVKNFAKHQNIKVEEKNKSKDNGGRLENPKTKVAEVSKNEGSITIMKNEVTQEKQTQFEKEIINKINQNEPKNITEDKVNTNSQDNIPIFLEVKNNKKSKANKKEIINEIVESNFEDNLDNQIDGVQDEERPLGKGERILMEFSMSS